MILYRTPDGALLATDDSWHAVDAPDWDSLFNRDDLPDHLCRATRGPEIARPTSILAPIGSQEVWAAGVTYLRSRTARMEESMDSGHASIYDRVYHAQRPELFLKATPHRCVADGCAMHLRRDSEWIVPEPELTLAVNAAGSVIGYTIGNDLSCRDIEGQNPLYLSQAKVFDRCAAIGPGILVTEQPLPESTVIRCVIHRNGKRVFEGETALERMKKKPLQLVEYLYRDNRFPVGCLLMTGTGIVPPDDFSLRTGDVVEITIDGIGTLSNFMQ